MDFLNLVSWQDIDWFCSKFNIQFLLYSFLFWVFWVVSYGYLYFMRVVNIVLYGIERYKCDLNFIDYY